MKLVPPWQSVDVMGVNVSSVSVEDFQRGLIQSVSGEAGSFTSGTPLFVTYINAACSNIAAEDPSYSQILKGADCVYADGQAIVWAAGLLNAPLPERVNAGDFILDFCRNAAESGLSIALVGGRPGVAQSAAFQWKKQVPNLNFAGSWDGFFAGRDSEVISAIAKVKPDILLIGMGVPLQEKWGWENRHRFNAKAIWCVGALFEYYGEGRARAPVWIRRIGLEWLFRLCLEPRRLWRRYLIGNVRFVWRLLKVKSKLRVR